MYLTQLLQIHVYLLISVSSKNLAQNSVPKPDKSNANIQSTMANISTSNKEERNKSKENLLCNKNFNKTVHVCSMASSPGDFGNLRQNKRVLVFRINKRDIKLFINVNQVTLPNATIKFDSKNNLVPVYHEEISKHLFSFYSGSIAFLDIALPFTAQWDGFKFSGKVVYLNVEFELQYKSIWEANFYQRDHCFYCQASCSEIKFVETSNKIIHDLEDLFGFSFGSSNEVHSLYFSEIETVNEKSRRPQRSSGFETPSPRSCSLHIVADHLFHRYYGAGSITNTVNMMLQLINDADAVFRSTDFDGDGQGDNIGFIVGKVTVYSINDKDYILNRPKVTSDQYLKLLSKSDFGDVCLGVAFTRRNMNGVAGTAFPGYSDETMPGGICQPRIRTYSYYSSLNAAFINFYDHSQSSHDRMVLALVHELAHSFGAMHDDLTECVSGGEYGNYIMFSKTNPGNQPNNRKFSVCSITSILPVIRKKGSCFLQDNVVPQCGNSIPEAGEECDCGLAINCMLIDPCCTPGDADTGPDLPCRIRRSNNKLCSPKKHACCTENCTYIPSSAKHDCNIMDGCALLSRCDGRSGNCPVSHPKPDGTLCNLGLDVCKEGKCSVEVCKSLNLSTCLCIKEYDKCKVCCKEPKNGTCLPLSDLGIRFPDGSIIHHDIGASCIDEGYCGVTRTCFQNIEASKGGSKTVFLGFSSEKQFRNHAKNYWFYYILVTLSFFFVIIILSISYKTNDLDFLKALRYGKMLAIFAMGEHQTKVYRKMLIDIDINYTRKIHYIQRRCEPLDYTSAVARLMVLFPNISSSYISRIVKISATEHMAVKILLLQGFKMRTFRTGN